MKYVLLSTLFFIIACGQQKKYHKQTDEEQASINSDAVRKILYFQNKLNSEFKDPESSPLPDRFRKDFEGLDFFMPDTNYIVTAKLQRTPDAEPFLLPTTTSRKSHEKLYAIAHFVLNGIEHQLEIYQSLELLDEEGYEDYLFLPFLDNTNGEETYAGGRYIDLKEPEGDSIVIDFNRAYNPYCVYNKKYSCPLVPRQNYMKTKVLAGVKDFIKH
ncbi:DUF1684 domain-containing protein [Flavobacterium sp. ASW18X]|uniref:DUF1684 domain-containing protein n=1 Tax=Flavobacterium sp. ASW18X TaxID=2572595 RepID=UPI0010AE3DE4|nr:DUF1684 domain-containing protein [Flavobacterium sp. ASW18X]TKD61382.1 DUF1684 domain-containing protein [Flavobacterium sp. ASW18X]